MSHKNVIVINGVSIEVDGNNVSVRAGTVYVNDQPVQSGLSGSVCIYWFGELANLETNGSATVHGNVHGNVRANGSVHCDDVKGWGKTKVNGNINANGSVNFR